MTVNPLDVAVVLTIALFVVAGAMRGFLGEVFSLAAWVAAILAGWALSPLLMPQLARFVHSPVFRHVAAFVLIFVIVFIAVGIGGFVVRRAILRGGIKTADHALGAALGAVRGIVILTGLVMLAHLTSLSRAPWWRGSYLAPYLQKTAGLIARHLPIRVARTMGYR